MRKIPWMKLIYQKNMEVKQKDGLSVSFFHYYIIFGNLSGPWSRNSYHIVIIQYDNIFSNNYRNELTFGYYKVIQFRIDK